MTSDYYIHSLSDKPTLIKDVGIACFNAWPEIATKDFGLKNSEEFIANLQDEMNTSSIIVLVALATATDDFIGTVSLRLTSDMPNHMPKLTHWMSCLFVSEKMRNRGIGSHLVKSICDIALKLNILTVYLWTENSNVMFYKRLGWTYKQQIEYYGSIVTIMQFDTNLNSLKLFKDTFI